MAGALTEADEAATSVAAERTPHRFADWDWVTFALVAVPVVCFVVLAWRFRWTSDDGFINVRIVQQILHGNGPVFNAGERVEAATSPAWIALLLVFRPLFLWLPIEWEAALLGFATTLGALAAALIASRRLFGTTKLVPFGLLVYLVLPPSWDYTTSGLENGLSLLWIAAAQLCLVTVARAATKRNLVVAAVVIGLAPLVRPDFVVLGTLYALAVLYVGWSAARPMLGRLALAGLAIPVFYQLFRMAYYGSLVPNPVYAKSGASSYWSQGWYYLTDFVTPYLLWIPILLLAVWFVANRTTGDRNHRVALYTPVVAATVYALFVVRGGGYHMHARMLLPVLFGLLLPVFAVPRSRANITLAVGAVAWAIVPLVALGPRYHGLGPHGIANERTVWMKDSDVSVTLDDFQHTNFGILADAGDVAADAARNHDRTLLSGDRLPRAVEVVGPLDPSVPYDAVLTVGPVGITGVAAGTDVYIQDMLGLADPLDARTTITKRSTPGHEKLLPRAWVAARFLDPQADVPSWFAKPTEIEAARRALACPSVARLFDRARDDLSPSRAATNVVQAVTDARVAVDPHPEIAARC